MFGFLSGITSSPFFIRCHYNSRLAARCSEEIDQLLWEVLTTATDKFFSSPVSYPLPPTFSSLPRRVLCLISQSTIDGRRPIRGLGRCVAPNRQTSPLGRRWSIRAFVDPHQSCQRRK